MPPSSSKSRPRLKNILAISLLVLLTGVLLSSNIGRGPFGKGQVLGVSFPNLANFLNLSSSFSFMYKSQALSKIVQKNLSDKEGDYEVFIEDLTDEENYGFNQNEVVPSASLYKLYLMAAVLKEVEAGALSLESVLTADRSHLEDVFGGTDFGYEESEEKIFYTIDEALIRVGRISDNFAALMLAEKVTWKKVQEAANENGATATKIKSPISTTALDIATFYKKLYAGQVVSANVSTQIQDYLLLSNLSNRIPAKLPEGTKVVHKTGELAGIRHDAGIVYLENRPYLIVLMSQNLKYEDEGIETLAQISKDVFDYFNTKQ